jgi:hypothetical protein
MKKFLATVLAASVASSTMVGLASAHDPKKSGPITSVLPAVAAPIGVGALVGSTTTSLTWSTIHTKVWTYPWTHTKGLFGLPNPTQYITQGAHATGQYLHNVIDPYYFNEHLYLSDPHPLKPGTTGEHKTTADYKKHHQRGDKSRSTQGKIVVGCIMGSALGIISAAARKASAMGNPPRLRSQAEHEKIVASGVEKQFELTNGEASTAAALCGAGTFVLHWPQQAAPVVVKAKG